jgi:signal transduction histidine kinase
VPDSTAPDRQARLAPSTRILLDAVGAMSSDVGLHGALDRIVQSAASITGARYGALGMLADDGVLADVAVVGLEEAEIDLLGEVSLGHGLAAELLDHQGAFRLADLADHPAIWGLPIRRPPMRSFLGVSVRIRESVVGCLYLAEKAGGEFTAEDEAVLSSLAAAAGYVIENARAYTRSERRRQWLEATADLTATLQPPIDLASARLLVARTARSVSRARAVAIGTRDEHGPVACLAADPADHDHYHELTRWLAERMPFRVDEIAEDVVGGAYAVVVPMRSHLAGRGAVVAWYDRPLPGDDPEERDLLAAFAEQAALALDRARAVEDRADLAVVSDRERIARDLHDVVIQRLFATGLQLQAAGLSLTDPDQSPRIEAAVDALDQTIKDIRRTIFELRHRGQPARAEIRDLIREYVAVLGYTPVLRTTGPVDTVVAGLLREHLLSVLREALSNVARHARATEVDVEVSASTTTVTLVVIDNGVGPGDSERRSGLLNARRRAQDLGGAFTLEAARPRGTELRWTASVP